MWICRLYNVVGIQGQKSAFAHDLEFTGVLYEHVPNAHHLASIAFGKLPCRLPTIGRLFLSILGSAC